MRRHEERFMRMPSTPSPWPALLVSFGLHALVVLGAWYFVASDSRAPMSLGTITETTDRLALSIIFDSGSPARKPAKPIDTVIEEQTATDTSVELEATPMFNPIISSPAPLHPVAAPPMVSSGPGIAPTPNTNGGLGQGGSGEGPFFPVVSKAHSVVYVIDRSASMGMNRGAFRRASIELLTGLRQLPPDVQFQVVAYNDGQPHCLIAPDQLRPAQPEIVAQFVRAIDDPKLLPEGKTNHVAALRHALYLNPDAIYWVTDGDDFSPRGLNDVLTANRAQTAIHLIDMGYGTRAVDSPLIQLTKITHGTYRAVRPVPQVTAIPGLARQ
jgi:hypothetical protein